MLITTAKLNELRVAFSLIYQQAFDEAKPEYMNVATVVPSSTKSNTYGWLSKFPNLREWIGERQILNIAEHAYSIANKHFESTVGVSKDDMDDDNLGVYNPLFAEMGRAAAIHPDQLVWPLLAKGNVTPCFDGQNFFDTEHPVYLSNDGEGDATMISNYQEGDHSAWYLVDTSRAVKPIIFQQRKKPAFVRMDQPNDEGVFLNNECRYGVDCRDNVGYGFWQTAYMSKAELTYDNVWAAYSAMRGFKTDGERNLGIMPTTLVVPLNLEKQACRIIDRERLDNGESNDLYKKFSIVAPRYLPNA